MRPLVFTPPWLRYYYGGSIVPMQWTAQHGCGGNSNVNCEIVIQYGRCRLAVAGGLVGWLPLLVVCCGGFRYMCEDGNPKLRDGTPKDGALPLRTLEQRYPRPLRAPHPTVLSGCPLVH